MCNLLCAALQCKNAALPLIEKRKRAHMAFVLSKLLILQ